MSDYEFPGTPNLEEAYRTAYRALAGLVPPKAVIPEKESSFPEVLSHFRILVDKVELAVDAQLGPGISWQAPAPDGDWDLVIAGIDLEAGKAQMGAVQSRASASAPGGGTAWCPRVGEPESLRSAWSHVLCRCFVCV